MEVESKNAKSPTTQNVPPGLSQEAHRGQNTQKLTDTATFVPKKLMSRCVILSISIIIRAYECQFQQTD